MIFILNKTYLNFVLEHCCKFKRTDIIYYNGNFAKQNSIPNK